MICSCPACGARFSWEILCTDEAARRAVAAALALPPKLAERIPRYLALFRPRKQALRWDKAERLLTEMSQAIQAGQVERNGRAYAAPLDAWVAALDRMIDSPPKGLPLKDHSYLYSILANAGEQQAAKAETHQEIKRRIAPEGQRQGIVNVGKHIQALKGAIK
jgi:hypothetical protein